MIDLIWKFVLMCFFIGAAGLVFLIYIWFLVGFVGLMRIVFFWYRRKPVELREAIGEIADWHKEPIYFFRRHFVRKPKR